MIFRVRSARLAVRLFARAEVPAALLENLFISCSHANHSINQHIARPAEKRRGQAGGGRGNGEESYTILTRKSTLSSSKFRHFHVHVQFRQISEYLDSNPVEIEL